MPKIKITTKGNIKRIDITVDKNDKDNIPDIIKKIQKIDKHRSEYYKYYTGKDWNDARNYDFCLNTASMSYEQLIEVVKNYIKTFKK